MSMEADPRIGPIDGMSAPRNRNILRLGGASEPGHIPRASPDDSGFSNRTHAV